MTYHGRLRLCPSSLLGAVLHRVRQVRERPSFAGRGRDDLCVLPTQRDLRRILLWVFQHPDGPRGHASLAIALPQDAGAPSADFNSERFCWLQQTIHARQTKTVSG